MPRYRFNIHGDPLPDELGNELPDLPAARVFAVRLASDCLRDQAPRFRDGGEWAMDVADEHGAIRFTLKVTGTDA